MSRKGVLIAALVASQVVTVVAAAHATPAVPEPATLTFLGVGTGAIAVGVWWRNRRRK